MPQGRAGIRKRVRRLSLTSSLLVLGGLASCVTYRYTSGHEEDFDAKEDEFALPELVTGGNASNFSSDLSPNGAYILYTSSQTGNKDIWQKKISKGVSSRLTFHTADDMSPAVSPDGKHFAFVSRRQDAAGDIHFMDLGSFFGTASENEVESFDLKESEDAQPAWFPDSEHIAFTARLPYETDPQIMVGDTDTETAKPLEGARGTHPAVSPDGDWLAYSLNGSVYLYDLKKHTKTKLTDGMIAKDGQPYFSHDSKYLYFIRYVQDTNHDRKVDGDDRPSLWRIEFGKWLDKPNIPSLAAVPLTSSRFSCYYPRSMAPYIYFTMQSQDSLDVFRLPDYGHRPIAYDKAVNLEHPRESSDTDDTAYYYYRRAHILFIQGKTAELQNYLLRELYWQVQTNQVQEAQWTYHHIERNFPEDQDLKSLAELLLVKLKVQPITYPDRKFDPTDDELAVFGQSQAAIAHILPKIKLDSPHRTDADVVATMIEARLIASKKQYFDALKNMEKILELRKPQYFVKAESQLLIADLIATVMDKATAVTKLIDVIKQNSADSVICKKASRMIVDIVNDNYDNNLEELARIRDANMDIPWLSPIAHRSIADHYQKVGDTNVAVNELREMVNRYASTPEIALKSAETLVKLTEVNVSGTLENDLEVLYHTFKAEKSEDLAQSALKIMVRFRVKKAESYMRQDNLELAMDQYQRIVGLDKFNLDGHRGIINILARRHKLDEAYDRYEKFLDESPNAVEYRYLLGYVKTFEIDEEDSVGGKLSAIDDALSEVEEAAEKNGKLVRVRQTLGWLYFQRHIWERFRAQDGGIVQNLRERAGIFGTYLGISSTDWLDLSVNSYLTAHFLSEPNSFERSELNQNLAEAYFEMKNYKKALTYYVNRIREINNFPMKSAREEAIFTHNAGKAAFQLAETKLAAKLFEKSLMSWQKVGNEYEIARNLDYLGLLKTETNELDQALDYYNKLIESHKRQGNQVNLAVAKINLANIQIKQKNNADALANLDEAKATLSDSQLEINVPKLDAIEIGLADGQASETAGFDKLSRLIQIEALKGKIYAAQNETEHLISSYEAKLALQLEKREEGIDQGRNDLYYAEELMTTYGLLGNLYKEISFVNKAKEAYFQALHWAHRRRPEEAKKPTEAESQFVVAYMKMQLERQMLGQVDKDEAALETGLSANHIALLGQPEVTATDHFYIGKIAPILNQMRLAAEEPAAFAGYQEVLAELTKVPGKDKALPQALVATQVPSFKDDQTVQTADEIREVKSLVINDRSALWKYLLAKGMWRKCYEMLGSRFEVEDSKDPAKGIKPLSIVQSGIDLAVMDKLFDFSFGSLAASAVADKLDFAARYYSLRSLYLADMLFSDTRIPSVESALQPKPMAEVQKSLGSNEGIILIHENQYGGIDLFGIRNSTVAHVYAKNIPPANLSEFIKAKMPKGHLYIVSNEYAHRLNWSELVPESTFSFVLSPHTIPFAKKKSVPGMASWADLTDADKDLISIKEPLEYQRTAKVSDLNRFANYVLVRMPLLIERRHPQMNVLMLQKDGAPDPMTLDQLKLPRGDQIHALIYAKSSENKDEISHFKPYQNLQAIHLVSMANQVKTTMVSNTEAASDETWASLALGAKGSSVLNYANKHGITVFGLAETEVEPDDIAEEFKTAIDDEEFRQALYYAKIEGNEAHLGQVFLALRDQSLAARDYERALYFQEKRLNRMTTKKGYDYANNLHLAAQYALTSKSFEKADGYFKDAIKIFTDEEEFGQAALATKNLALNFERRKMFKEAIDSQTKSREFFLKDDDAKQAAARLHDLGNLHNLYFSDYIRAVDFYQKAEQEFQKLGDSATLERIAIDKANTFIVTGQLTSAIQILQDILKPIDITKNNLDQNTLKKWIRTSQILANAYYRASLNQDASRIIANLLSKIDEIGDEATRISYNLDATNLQAMVEAKLGSVERAITMLKDGITIAEEHKLKSKMTQRYNNLGFLYRENGDYHASVEAMERALKIDQVLDSDSGVAYDLRNLGLSVGLLGDRKLAKEYLEKSLKLSTDLNLSYNATYCYFGLGDLALKEHSYSEAMDLFQKAHEIAQKGFLGDFQWRALAAIAFAEQALGNSSNALSYYGKAVDVIEAQPAGQKTESSQTGLASDMGIHEVYQRFASLLVSSGRQEDAWAMAERSRARGFIDTIGSQNITFRRPEINQAIYKYKELQAAIEIKKREISLASGNKQLNQDLAGLVAALDQHLANLQAQNPQLAAFLSSQNMALADLYKIIPEKNALLEYFVTSNSVIVWFIKKGSIVVKETEISRADLSAKIAVMRNLLNAYSTTDFVSQDLADILIKPLKIELDSVDKLVIAPHSFLNHLSFALLPFENKLLIDRFPISYVESANYLALLPKSKTLAKGARILAIGAPEIAVEQKSVPIPFALKEVETIKRFFPETKVFTGKDATEALLQKPQDNFNVIHIASHGSFNTMTPIKSYVAFAKSEGSDGILDVAEAFNLDLKADLVTLSSCETGMGAMSTGDEVIGFDRALFFAGANSVVSALWRINDVASAMVMKRFYRYLADGLPKDEALRKSQLSLRQYLKHPSYWAAFRVVGNTL